MGQNATVIDRNLTANQIYELLETINGSGDEMRRLEEQIDQICEKDLPLSCRQLFEMAGMECPKELENYGWPYTKEKLEDGYFYQFSMRNEDGETVWYIDYPFPQIMPFDTKE